MTTSSSRIHEDSDFALLRSNNRFLETENANLRETLRDRFAMAAMQGLLTYYGDRDSIVDTDSRISLHAAAYDHADSMMQARVKRLVMPDAQLAKCLSNATLGFCNE